MDYDDIIDLPHPDPKYHPRMLPYKRAAQFKPFSPLNGYDKLLRQQEEAVRHAVEERDAPKNLD